tara:strand:+ start:252 stop:1076 length:825 start_codon:yes stop_codon:yes gene_type:complete
MYELKSIGHALGAEVYGIDLATGATTQDYSDIHSLLLRYEVLFFRDQDISHAQHKALAEFFGPLQTHPAYDAVDGFPEIAILESTAEKPSKIESWHSDMTFRQHPPVGTILRSKIIPAEGGDTLWSTMTAAYEGLSKEMKNLLSGLEAVHDFSCGFKESLSEPGGRERLARAVADNPPVKHPVIHTHPETGKKVIYVNALFTTHILNIPRKESKAILNFLFKHIKQDEFTCRFSWEPNCIAIWDNRSTQHKPVNDYFPEHRKLERITIDGHLHY